MNRKKQVQKKQHPAHSGNLFGRIAPGAASANCMFIVYSLFLQGMKLSFPAGFRCSALRPPAQSTAVRKLPRYARK